MLLDLPIELLREIVLSFDELSDFGASILTCRTFYQSVSGDIIKHKIKLQTRITINNILRSHKGRIGNTSSVSKLQSEEYYMGTLRDMISETKTTFQLAKGDWEIYDYYDHAYYVYGYHMDYVNARIQEMVLIHTSESYDDYYGISCKCMFDECSRAGFEIDKAEYDELTKEDWTEMLHANWTDWQDDFYHNELCISGGRGEDTFCVYAAKDWDGLIIAWWILPKSDDIVDILTCWY